MLSLGRIRKNICPKMELDCSVGAAVSVKRKWGRVSIPGECENILYYLYSYISILVCPMTSGLIICLWRETRS